MFRYPDGTFRQNPPARVELHGFVRMFTDLAREQWDEIGFNEALPVPREPFTEYATSWEKGEDLIYREIVSGATVDEAAKAENEARAVRAERDRLLLASDWTQLADSPLSDSGKAAWVAYRRELREVPEQAGFPDAVAWPVCPES